MQRRSNASLLLGPLGSLALLVAASPATAQYLYAGANGDGSGENGPPVMAPISDMQVDPGSVAEQIVTASDPDGDSLTFYKESGPLWMGVATETRTAARITVTPPGAVGGVFNALVGTTDGHLSGHAAFHIVVNAPTHPPVFVGIQQALEVAEEGFTMKSVYATDPDGVESLHFFKVAGPRFMDVLDGDGMPGAENAHAYVTAEPHAGDRGDYTGIVGVTDGLTTTTQEVSIWVVSRYPGDTSVWLQGDPGNPYLDGESFRASQILRAARSSAGTLTFTLEPAITPGDIELEPRLQGDEWLDCARGRRGTFRFSSPTGDSLRVGRYEGALLVADASHPGLDVSVGCVRSTVIRGRFELKELHLANDGTVRSAWVTFELFAEGSPAPLRGDLRFQEREPPVTIYAPGRLLVGVEDDVSFVVSAADSALGSVALQSDLPLGASLVPDGDPNGFLFTWRPHFDQDGVHRVGFRASNAAGDTGFAFCDITVRPRNAVSAVLDSRQLEFFTSNRGVFACDLRDSTSGFNYRGPGGPFPVASSAGIWLGALVNGATRVARGGMSPEFVPGTALAGQSRPFDPRFKNYKIFRARTDTPDTRTWPVDQGAPTDAAGQPAVLGDVTAWSSYNDGDPSAHAPPAEGSAPLGVEVRQTSWAFDHDGPAGRVVRLRFEIRNTSADPLTRAYASVWMDPHAERRYGIGEVPVVEVYNDLVGCDSSRAMGFAYGSKDYGGSGRAIGVSMLRGALRRTAGGDSVQLGMTSFRRLQAAPSSAEGVYRVMQGLHEDGTAVLDPAAQPTSFEVPGDPTQGTGWLDEEAASTGGKLLLVSTGPFDMLPGETQTIEVAIAVGVGSDRFHAIADLRSTVDVARGLSPVGNTPPRFDVSRRLDLDENTPMRFALRAWDPDGDRLIHTATLLPPGASLTPDGFLAWTPSYDQAGSYRARLVATDVFGAWDSATFVLDVHNVNRAPIVQIGGPYHGVMGTALEFDAGASSDPDGDPIRASWSFGDGATADGSNVLHIYFAPGIYKVSLLVGDGSITMIDTTAAVIAPPIRVQAVVGAGGGAIRLTSPAPAVTLSLEIEGGGLSLESLLGATFTLETMGAGTVPSIASVEGETRIGGDANANGLPELSLVFRKDDLRELFRYMPPGRTTTTALLTGIAGGVPALAAEIPLTIEAAPHALAAVLAPNPINPRGTLTFLTSRAGKVAVSLFDARGRLVRTLLDVETAPQGYHDVAIDGRDGQGRPLASGVYFYRIDAAEGTTSGRIAILK